MSGFSKPRNVTSPKKMAQHVEPVISTTSSEALETSGVGSLDDLDDVPSVMVSPPSPRTPKPTDDEHFQVPTVKEPSIGM